MLLYVGWADDVSPESILEALLQEYVIAPIHDTVTFAIVAHLET
jgi:hypothetical protein